MTINLGYWHHMPEFVQQKIRPYHKVKCKIGAEHVFIRFDSQDALEGFSKNMAFGVSTKDSTIECSSRLVLAEASCQKITEKTKSIWFPFKAHKLKNKRVYVGDCPRPRYPVYIVSKGRSKNGLTTKALDDMGVRHFMVVERQEFDEYQGRTSADILILPEKYLAEYDTFDDLGCTKSKGPGAARNFCLDHSKRLGFKRHWVMDDNLDAFHYLNRNEKFEVESCGTLSATEDFVDRFSNVPVSGLNYYSMCKKDDKVPPYTTNTRIYSCLLIDNDMRHRWRGRYNEDTDLSLRVLKDGDCTIQMNAFLCGKVATQRMSGGNSKEFYRNEGTLPKSEMIARMHPDVASVVWRFNRWHHLVNYSTFKGNKLKLRSDAPKPGDGKRHVFNYGLVKKEVRNAP